MMESDQNTIDEAILSAIQPAAVDLEQSLSDDGDPVECLVTWAVVTFEYLDAAGERQHGYRRVNATWFDVAGASKMLETANAEAWHVQNGDGED